MRVLYTHINRSHCQSSHRLRRLTKRGVGFWCRISSLAAFGALGEAGLDGVPDAGLEADAVEAVDLLNAGRRGDVDLGEVVADHVDADENQPLLFQGRADGSADRAGWRR